MEKIAREGDIATGNCSAHNNRTVTGYITIPAGATKINHQEKNVATVGDRVLFDCGHEGEIKTGLKGIKCNGKDIAQVGSIVGGIVNGIIITGGEKTSIG